MPLELFIALRYLKARRKGVFTLLTSIIAIGGITLGVAALIITLGVMSGFHADIKEKILGVQPHLIVLKNNYEAFKDYKTVLESINKNKHVTASAPFVYGQTIIRRGQSGIGAAVKGIDPAAEDKLVSLHKIVLSGKPWSPEIADGEIIIGVELAQNIGVMTGQEVVLVTPGMYSMVPQMQKFKVKYLFHSGMYEYDANLAYINLNDAKKLFLTGDAVSGIGVSVDDWENADIIGKEIQSKLSDGYWVRSWQRMNRNLFSALKLEKIMMFIILALIIIVAAFNIISNLLLLTVEKTKEIGILSALGFEKAKIARIFFYEGLIMGITGITAGLATGFGLSMLLKKYQFIHLPADVYYLDHLPVKILAGDVLSVVCATLIITVIAGIYPAYQVTKLDPLEAIRYG